MRLPAFALHLATLPQASLPHLSAEQMHRWHRCLTEDLPTHLPAVATTLAVRPRETSVPLTAGLPMRLPARLWCGRRQRQMHALCPSSRLRSRCAGLGRCFKVVLLPPCWSRQSLLELAQPCKYTSMVAWVVLTCRIQCAPGSSLAACPQAPQRWKLSSEQPFQKPTKINKQTCGTLRCGIFLCMCFQIVAYLCLHGFFASYEFNVYGACSIFTLPPLLSRGRRALFGVVCFLLELY